MVTKRDTMTLVSRTIRTALFCPDCIDFRLKSFRLQDRGAIQWLDLRRDRLEPVYSSEARDRARLALQSSQKKRRLG